MCTEPEERAEFIQGLLDLAAFLQAHPAVPCPTSETLNAFATKEALAACATQTSWGKEYFDAWFSLNKHFGPIRFDVNVPREDVCRRVVTGTRTLPAQPEQTVEVVEWVCDEPLLKAFA